MRLKLLTVTLLAASLLTACSSSNMNEGKAKNVKETANIKKLVSDYSAGNKKAENASITSQQLIVKEKDGSQTSYDLPKKDFFVSIAPYTTKTHP